MTAPTITHLPGGELQMTTDCYVARYDVDGRLLRIRDFNPEYGPDGPRNAGALLLSIEVYRDRWEPAQLIRHILTALEGYGDVLLALDDAQAHLAEGETELAAAAVARAQEALR